MHVVDTVNARQLVTAAQEVGAVVHAGPLRHLPATEGWQLGEDDLGEHLRQYSDQQVVLIVVPVEEVVAVLCQVCAFPLDAAGACPRCALRAEVAALRRIIEPALRMRAIEERMIRLGDREY